MGRLSLLLCPYSLQAPHLWERHASGAHLQASVGVVIEDLSHQSGVVEIRTGVCPNSLYNG